MILVTTETVPGRNIEKSVGLVRGNTVRARHIGRDIIATLRNLVGGEISEYSELMTEARNEALKRMIAQAEQQGADAIVGIRFITAQISRGSAELVAYGTAVRLRENA
ncbi:MAG: heavy metal-binding domain-containing protein [Wenzhouxiangellaceae bacterium]|nr:heavy metal-binding domain-containing protein [Wenzhouxiangellaceae bacterium]